MRIRWVAFVGAALFPLFGCATGENPEAAVDRGVVSVDGGSIRGVAGGERADVWMYREVPYAAPPLGMGRWRPPAPVTPWEGVRDATTFSPACVQNRRPSESFYGPGADAMSEDCLYLNVWTTATPEERQPVMVWVHGGGLRNGTGAQVTYDGSALARRGVVVVTLNYRLGPFGYLAHPLLTAESANNASGNYGVLDQIAALQWVQRNIEGFGGNPDRVTIFGESAGSWSVHSLVATPLAAGLFHGAIGQSGGVFGSFGGTPSLASGEAGGERFASSLLGDQEATLEAMRAATSDEVLTAMTTDRGPIPMRPVVDGWVLPNTVYAIFAAGEQNDVPVIVGSNADEGTALTGGAGPRTVEEFRQFARQFGASTEDFLAAYPATSEAEVRTAFLDSYTDRSFGWEMRTWARMQRASDAYLYFFSRVAPAADADQYGAFHAAEIIYVFDNLGRSPHRYANRDYDDTDQRVADVMASYWVNFATTGNPNGEGLSAWPRYRDAADEALVFGDEVTVRHGIRKPGLDFFDRYYAAHREAET